MSSEENNNLSQIEKAVHVVKEITDAVPVYPDLVQPAAKEIGKSLQTVAKLVNVALAPVAGLVWGYEKIADYLSKRLSEKLEKVPKEDIITPSPQVAGPAIEALKFVGEEETLRELYANLIASAMNKNTVEKVHPSYVEILKNISPDEALLLKAFIKKENYPLFDVKVILLNGGIWEYYLNYSDFQRSVGLPYVYVNKYIDNLCRLGILRIPDKKHLNHAPLYSALMVSLNEDIPKIKETVFNDGSRFEFERKLIEITVFGRDFVKTVIS